ncbi:hypothetical protein [Acaryochloris sp. IP29b_bin.137]|uniref:hypothetical protein n=1 Tax=Acaryochloris sp. IP29b_bin.137 TaxID=2969217 RepID=UPI0026068AFE|nr:hypothetical protein [Acaryochloris sp. IP29b_bin.137]
MSHPFELDIHELTALHLEGIESIPDNQAASVQGGSYPPSQTLTAVGPNESGESGNVTTLALGEEGGMHDLPTLDLPGSYPFPLPYPQPGDPTATTYALGEEGG